MRLLALLLASFLTVSAAAQSGPPHTLDAPTRAHLQIELREMNLADQRARYMEQYATFSPCESDSLREALHDLSAEAYVERSRELYTEATARTTDAERAVLQRMVHDTDAVILARLREIIAAHGWPSDERTGADASPIIFLLHSPHKMDEMRPELHAEVRAGRLSARHFAMAMDKARKVRGELQLYGTADEYDTATATILPPRIESIEATNAARREIGLGPLEAYRVE